MATRRKTTEQYLRTPETVLPQELVYGVVRDAPAPYERHQDALLTFARALAAHVEDRGLGKVWVSPIDVILDRERALVVQPDLVFVSAVRMGIVINQVWGAPDMVLEVLSPHPRIGKLNERIEWFAKYGVRECWLLHQLERRLEVLSMSDGRVSARESFDEPAPIRSLVLPDFDRTLRSILVR